MPNGSPLYLHEQVLLLALHDDQGTVSNGWRYGLGGAALAELILAERVRIELVRKNRLLTVERRTHTGESYLDECLDLVVNAKRRASAMTWVGRFGAINGARNRVADRLCQRGILRRAEGRVLLVFSRSLYPTVDPEPERELLRRLDAAIFGDDPVDARTAILATLAYHTGMLNRVFDKQQLKRRKERLEAMASSTVVGDVIREAIAAATAAMIAATTAAGAGAG